MGMAPLFDERRAAQAAALLLHKAGGSLPVIKLLKLMYLAERRSLQLFGEPLTGDRLVSMPHGPVLSMTYEHISGSLPSIADGWDSWITDRAGHEVSLGRGLDSEAPETVLQWLSETDVEVLDAVWKEFGHWDRWALVAYTHSSACPEWHDPEGSSLPISYEALFAAVGYSPEQAAMLTERLATQRDLMATRA